MSASLELAAKMPWILAKGETWWLITGTNKDGAFEDCIARVVPEFVTGVRDVPLFEMMLFGGPQMVRAADITAASELFFVYARDPLRAYYEDDQDSIDVALRSTS